MLGEKLTSLSLAIEGFHVQDNGVLHLADNRANRNHLNTGPKLNSYLRPNEVKDMPTLIKCGRDELESLVNEQVENPPKCSLIFSDGVPGDFEHFDGGCCATRRNTALHQNPCIFLC